MLRRELSQLALGAVQLPRPRNAPQTISATHHPTWCV
jgi:hypothetical protein